MREPGWQLRDEEKRLAAKARQVRRLEAELGVARGALDDELRLAVDRDEGYGMAVTDVARLAQLSRESVYQAIRRSRAGADVTAARWDPDAALANWTEHTE